MRPYNLITIQCSQCNEPIGYYLIKRGHNTVSHPNSIHCYSCMLSFLEFAELLNGTHEESLTNFPTKIELYHTTQTLNLQQQYRTACMKLINS